MYNYAVSSDGSLLLPLYVLYFAMVPGIVHPKQYIKYKMIENQTNQILELMPLFK